MKRPSPTPLALGLTALSAQFGVTRLARVTGLDRCDVEVCAAVRPRGHVLQVSQGKGLTFEAAQWSALGEAIELAAAEQPDAARLVYASAPPGTPWAVGDERIAWVEGRLLSTGAPVLVPAQEVYCPPAGAAWLGPISVQWKSNGLGFHPTSRRAAVTHAVHEVLERDAVARVLPDGWTAEVASSRLVRGANDQTHGADPLAAQLQARGFGVFVFDLSCGGHPVAGALLFDLEGGPVPLTAGYACRPTFEAAGLAALLEAAQSRLTEIHGAREDVTLGAREAGADLFRSLRSVAPTRLRAHRPAPPPPDAVVVCLRASPWVVKVVSPSLLVSGLL
jgi:ribosomal protein S12 methylthiotransferase accessory factor